MLANIRAEPTDRRPLFNQDQGILHYLIKCHYPNPSQALAVRHVLDKSCITALTRGAGKGKSETLVACIKAVLWQQGYIVAQNPDVAYFSAIILGRRVGGCQGHKPPRSCVLVTAHTNAQVDNLLSWVHEESSADLVFRAAVIGDHLAPWLRPYAQRATATARLRSHDHKKVQETLGDTSGCRPTLACAVNSCCEVFATSGIVVNRHMLPLVAAPRRPQTRFAFSFVDEASKHSIPAGFDLATMGSQCLLCGDLGQLRFSSHIQLLANATLLRGQPSRRAHTTMWICNPLALMCIGMTHNGSAPPPPCNFFSTPRCRASILAQQCSTA